MSNILFLYDNLLDSAALTESSEASGFAVENIQHPFRTKVWRTEGATAGTANVVIDHGSRKVVTCVPLQIITGHLRLKPGVRLLYGHYCFIPFPT